MKQIIFALILALGFGFSVFAQNEKTPCPNISVSGGGIVQPGELMTFTVSVVGEAANSKLEYEWTISNGTIVEGQGTTTITVNAPNFPKVGLTATVEIKGLPENCPNNFSESTIYDPPPKPTLIDEFGKLRDSEVKARLEAMYIKIGNEPESQGYIINYGTDKEIANRERQIRKAITFLKFEPSRVTLVRGGTNPNGTDVLTRIWIVPPGAENPTPDM